MLFNNLYYKSLGLLCVGVGFGIVGVEIMRWEFVEFGGEEVLWKVEELVVYGIKKEVWISLVGIICWWRIVFFF